VAPRQVPRVTGQLRHFLRASFDQHERLLVPLGGELAVVGAYLEIESLRLGDRLKVEQTIDPDVLRVLMPAFSLQPLVENAVQYGLHSSPQAGRFQLAVGVTGQWLEIGVSDDGQGVPSTGVEQLFFAERPRVHALALLRRRLRTRCPDVQANEIRARRCLQSDSPGVKKGQSRILLGIHLTPPWVWCNGWEWQMSKIIREPLLRWRADILKKETA
jgi:LytS/YehU family sensor histidine kinase